MQVATLVSCIINVQAFLHALMMDVRMKCLEMVIVIPSAISKIVVLIKWTVDFVRKGALLGI